MRVLFVDDEVQVLKGITRMLECADVDWDIEIATSGDAALELLEEESVDVLVSDMKMPGMDGAELLQKVSERFPATVRIVLSGQADKDAVYRAVSPMHQYLSKPCATETLRDTISRACSLREMLENTNSQNFLGRVSNLPSLPDLYQKVVREMEDENGKVANVGRLISEDPAMTAKILQLANSAIFGLQSKVTSAAQAASLVGMDTLKSLVLSMSVFESFKDTQVPGFSMESIAAHSREVGNLCLAIAKCEGLDKEVTNEAFTAGLLHDVGKLILATHASEEYAAAIANASASNVSTAVSERESLGIGHDGLGGYLLSLWGLPQSIVEGVAFHHSPSECMGASLTVPAIVCIANHLVESASPRGDDEGEQIEQLMDELKLLGRVDTWNERAERNE